MSTGALQSLVRVVREGWYFAFTAPKGLGRRKPIALWDEQYRSGHWEYLDSAAELAHYMVIVGYLHHFCDRPAVLDVGCGHGRLYELLRWYPHRAYLGIDHAFEGISRAQEHAGPHARFEVADFERFIPRERYDAIVFNESIYYAPEPVEILRRYAAALTPDGVMIVSMCYNRWQVPIWGALERAMRVVHSTTMTNERRVTWNVRVLRPRARRPRALR